MDRPLEYTNGLGGVTNAPATDVASVSVQRSASRNFDWFWPLTVPPPIDAESAGSFFARCFISSAIAELRLEISVVSALKRHGSASAKLHVTRMWLFCHRGAMASCERVIYE
jgi:hypothetical protein